MKKSKEINDINVELFSSLENIENGFNVVRDLVGDYYKKIKKEFSKLLIEEKYNLLLKIAEEENMDINMLKSKYMKAKELINLTETIQKKEITESEELLDRIEHNGQIYYFENKEKGIVYDVDYNEVGVFKNKTIILN